MSVAALKIVQETPTGNGVSHSDRSNNLKMIVEQMQSTARLIVKLSECHDLVDGVDTSNAVDGGHVATAIHLAVDHLRDLIVSGLEHGDADRVRAALSRLIGQTV